LTLVESTSDHEERIISEGIDFLKMERNPSREECEIGLEYMEEEEALEIKVSSEDDEDSVNVIIEETEDEEIHNWHDLDAVRDDLNRDYILMNDLDEETDGYGEYVDTENGWEPIGDSGNRFNGTFEGNGYEIKDLYIDRQNTEDVGLFGCVCTDGEVLNLGVIEADVSGHHAGGGLVGVNFGTILSSYATGEVSCDNLVGGLVGENSGTVENSYATTDVSGVDRVGGLVGRNDGTVSNSYATGEVSGADLYLGGLVGENSWIVENSYATADVSGIIW